MPRLALGRVLPAVIAVLLSLTVRIHPAAAQSAGNLTLDGFRPAIDARGYLTVNGSQTLESGEMSFGLGSLDWGHDLLELDANGKTYSIDNMITATLVGARGFHLGGLALEAGLSLPLRLMNGERGPNVMSTPGMTDGKSFALDGQGLGNIGAHLKAQLIDGERGPHIGLAVIASVYLPTIDPKDRFLGEDQWVPQLIGVLDKSFGDSRRFRLSLNGGIRLRKSTTFTDNDPGPDNAPVTGRSITVGSELPFGVGAAYAIAPERFDLVGEISGAMPLGAHQAYQPLEALAGVKLYLAKNSYLTLGAGRGLANQGGSPDARAFIGIVFEPGADKRGRNQIADDGEVFHGFNNDTGDRVDDTPPAEPPAPEPAPDLSSVVSLVDSQIIILKPINFEFDKAVIKPDSFYVLDAVVKTLGDNLDITLLEVQGHTDERGDDAYNLDLSERRAAAVRTYLVEHGITDERLTSHGYGETQPVDRHHNEAAWTKNRRVEFVIKHKL